MNNDPHRTERERATRASALPGLLAWPAPNLTAPLVNFTTLQMHNQIQGAAVTAGGQLGTDSTPVPMNSMQ